jgi:tRNA1(Val) A37 N6-methylase TrmN6
LPSLIDDVRFFDGKVRVDQPKTGYRAGNDAILLAASLTGKPGTRFLDLGCGSGIVMRLADHRLPGCQFVGTEKDPDMLKLARHNSSDQENIEIMDGDVGAFPKNLHLRFDQVVSNPPYFDDLNAVRMSKAMKPRGTGTLIYRADGLEKILHSLFGQAGNIRILPIHSHENEPAKRIIIQFRKGVKSESAILPPLIMHDRDSSKKYSEQAAKILCGEMPINMRA